MAGYRFLPILVMCCLLWACTNRVVVVEGEHDDGSVKKQITYVVDGDSKVKELEEGFYEDGRPEIIGKYDLEGNRTGEWKYWYPNGKLWSECNYAAGVREGKSAVYYDDGILRYEGNYKNDSAIGHWVFYDKEGLIATEKDY